MSPSEQGMPKWPLLGWLWKDVGTLWGSIWGTFGLLCCTFFGCISQTPQSHPKGPGRYQKGTILGPQNGAKATPADPYKTCTGIDGLHVHPLPKGTQNRTKNRYPTKGPNSWEKSCIWYHFGGLLGPTSDQKRYIKKDTNKEHKQKAPS